MSQSQCGRSPSQAGYPSSAWLAVTSPTTLQAASPSFTDKSFHPQQMPVRVVSSIRRRFQRLSQSEGQVTHVLLTRSPLFHPASWASSFDLHVLSTPPAFVLSQDQTLRKKQKAPHQPEKDRMCCKFDLTKVRTSLLTFICLSKKESPTPTNQTVSRCRG